MLFFDIPNPLDMLFDLAHPLGLWHVTWNSTRLQGILFASFHLKCPKQCNLFISISFKL
jgi:hypothetical protein